MPIEAPKPPHNHPDTQFNIFELSNAVQVINEKYPYAKVNPSIVTGDAITGFFVGGETLEAYAEDQNRLYAPEEDQKWYEKN